ncbi:MAG: HDIG domain-containing protein [Spirochaetes bacterium]|nr:HDIG domain-containing protein [Spirochaetota bacterium]
MAERIPTERECLELQREFGMLPNIADHSRQVKNVSLAIYENLRDRSIVNRDLVIAGALLHDIAKTRSIETGNRRHDLLGAEMMRELGYESIALAVESHVIMDNYNHDGPLEEREIIFYADKRVMHDTIVSVDDRVDDLVQRYGINEMIRTMIRENKNFVLMVERKIQGFMRDEMETVIRGIP